MHSPRYLTTLVIALTSVACGNSSPTTDAAADVAHDTISPPTDTGVAHDSAADTDTGSSGASLAGTPCMNDSACGSGGVLTCDTTDFPGQDFCTADCTNNASQTMEAAECGGSHATCLTQGDPGDMPFSTCTRSCTPTATTVAAGACAAGFVCTGFWYTHSAAPDSPGCFPLCANDTECTGGLHCNVRTGDCSGVFDAAALPDGEPCDPTAPANPCRGICFSVTDVATQGICGSFIVAMTGTEPCPDDPTDILVEGVDGDNLGLCNFKNCTTDCDCTLPAVCVSGGMVTQPVCAYVDPTDPGESNTPPPGGSCTAGGDGGADVVSSDAVTSDSAAADVATGG